MKALVLSGGGARGAYQVGVLNAIADIAKKIGNHQPFRIYSGISAGAINAAFLAAGSDDFYQTSRKLSDLWSSLTTDNVFKTDAVSLGKIGLRWVGELSFGSFTGTTPGRSLLETDPLYDLIRNNLNFSMIQKQIDKGALHALAITALNYKNSEAITFVQGQNNTNDWERTRRRSERAHIQAEHIMASSAIPLLFPPIAVGDRYFGDGCIRNQTPLSPSLHLGAKDLMVIGVRQNEKKLVNENDKSESAPSVAKVINVLLNSVLLDGIDVDIERLARINEFLSRVPEEHHGRLNFHRVNHVFIHPSADIGEIAAGMSSRLPRVVRYLLKGLGPLDDASEIISYLLFEPEFCQKLIEIGYQDGMKHSHKVEEFLSK